MSIVDAGMRPASVGVFHRTLHTFLEFCRREGLAIDERALEVAGPRQPIEEPETFTPDEAKRLIAAAHSERDKMLVEFMVRTGVRLAEVANLTVDDIVQTRDGPTCAYVTARGA